jgi:hypothetical protein
MKLQELDRRRDAFEHAKWSRLLPQILMLSLPVVFLPMAIYPLLRSAGTPIWLAVTIMVAGAPVWAECCDILPARLQRSHGVVCPQCGRAWVGHNGVIVLPGGQCVKCGAVVAQASVSETSTTES